MSDLPIIFQLLIVSFILAVIFSVTWVYLVPEKYHTKPSVPTDQPEKDDQETFTIEAVTSRRQAQERLFAQLEETKYLRQQRQEMNNQRYDVHLLPPHIKTITLHSAFNQDDDHYQGLVYAQAGDVPPITADQFADYWAIADKMLWAWQGDNIINDYGENSLKELMRERHAQMRASLLVSGWEIIGEKVGNSNLISSEQYTRSCYDEI